MDCRQSVNATTTVIVVEENPETTKTTATTVVNAKLIVETYLNTDDQKKNRPPPVCLLPPHKAEGINHYINDFSDFSEEEKNPLLKEQADSLAKNGPSRSTQAQKRDETFGANDGKKTTGRLQSSKIDMSSSASCPITVSDRMKSLNGTGCCDDGSDDSIASPKLAQTAVLKGNSSFEAIAPVKI